MSKTVADHPTSWERPSLVLAEPTLQWSPILRPDLAKVKELLEEPFDPELLFFLPKPLNRNKDKGMAAVYAQPRAYTDRLNDVVGPEGWTSDLEFLVAPYKKTWKDKVTEGTKLVCKATVTIFGVGTHVSCGEEDTSDENAATSAEAQALKRACVPFGLGRYFYSFPKKWYGWDNDASKWTEDIFIPDWAKPAARCTECNHKVTAIEMGDRSWSSAQVVQYSQQRYKQILCGDCCKKHAEAERTAAKTTPEKKSA